VDLQEYLACRRRLVDNALDDLLPSEDNEPSTLHKAMRYSVFAGGKRVRPILAMAAAEAVGAAAESVLPLAVSLECIHTYSLIHDDLPAMDDDDLRRGKPTAHKVFGEAVAILAGDALITLAFELLSSPKCVRTYPPERLLAAIGELAVAAGSQELVGGQAVDILSEGSDADLETVNYIINAKTGALIRASLTSGAILGGGNKDQVRILGRFGREMGAVFQIRDDLLDLEGDPEQLGKAVGKDKHRGKVTYPGLLGVSESRAEINRLVASSLEAIRPLGSWAEPLELLSRYVGERVN
jgi:geranylgeranyl diphosphate synthase, type II